MRAEHLDTRTRRDQIAQAALRLIATRGLRALSVAAVARQVGLVPSAIYRHFESKDRLLDATLEHLGDRLLSNVHLAAEETDDPLERLRRLLARHLRLIRENQAIPRVIFSEAIYGDRPERKARVHGIITRYIDHIAQFVLAGQRAGRIRSDLDPRGTAVAFLGLVLPVAVLWHLSDGKFDAARQSERGWRIFRAGIERAAGRGSVPARGGRVARKGAGA
ncbi:MAG TPA: TetR/AcrR family transcriptional regulator [Candidatus Eisenbacteria bacterium]|jgi:AcrR family transcriptional regulator